MNGIVIALLEYNHCCGLTWVTIEGLRGTSRQFGLSRPGGFDQHLGRHSLINVVDLGGKWPRFVAGHPV